MQADRLRQLACRWLQLVQNKQTEGTRILDWSTAALKLRSSAQCEILVKACDHFVK